MAEPTWPSTLPVPTLQGCSYEPKENTVRTQMDAGPAKVRRRFTAVTEDVTFTLELEDATQAQTLRQFVAAELKDVLPFNWIDFRNPPTTATYRFKRRPKITPLTAGGWQAVLELELLP